VLDPKTGKIVRYSDELWAKWGPLVQKLVESAWNKNSIARQMGDELFDAALDAAQKAMDTFDPAKGATISTWVQNNVQWAIKRAIAKEQKRRAGTDHLAGHEDRSDQYLADLDDRAVREWREDERADDLMEAVSRLPDDLRQIAEELLQGYSRSEIRERHGLTNKDLQSRLVEIRAELADVLD
jgi:RNA polymerase sigma factor (sigma-70 family)